MDSCKSIVLAGYYGYSNAGDDLILISLLNGFVEYLPETRVTVLNRMPASNYFAKYKCKRVNFINRYNLVAILSRLIRSNALIMGGGSLLQDESGCFTIYYYFLLMFIAKGLGKKLIIFNQGIGPVKFKFNRIVLKNILLNTDLIIVRDKYSKALIEKITNKKRNVILGADPVFNCTITQKNKNDRKTKNMGFSIRNWKNSAIKKKIIGISKKLKSNGWQSYNVPLHYPDDILNIKGISDIKWKNPCQIFKVFSNFDLFVGMRLHSLIIGALNNLPVIGINYDPKIKSFCDFMDIQCLEISEVNISSIEAGITEVYSKEIDYSGKLQLLKKRLKTSWEELREFLNK